MAHSCPLPWRVLSAPKRGHTDAEYEDAWAANPRTGRFAVADGAEICDGEGSRGDVGGGDDWVRGGRGNGIGRGGGLAGGER